MTNRDNLEGTIQLIRQEMDGAAIVNHTLDGLLSETGHQSRVAVIGPTASMVPDVYFRGGVDLMAGIRVTNPDLMLRILEEGGSGYHLFNACSDRVTFVRKVKEEDIGNRKHC